MSEPRHELAGIARSLRRALERERASGAGELLADSAKSARGRTGSSRPLAASIEDSEEIRGAGRAAAGERDEFDYALGGGARATASALTHGSDPPTAGRVAAESSGRIAAASGRVAVAEPPPAPVANLFGETPPPPPPTLADLPPFHPPLHPRDVTERAAIDADSLPVLDEIAGRVRSCRLCGLCDGRANAVPGVGSARSGIVFVGEAPGAEEDRRGEPFVGRAGELLTKIIKAMDDARLIDGVSLTRESVYICNVLKCRPPENRNPLPHEVELCSPYLRSQLEALQPRVICCLGKFAAELLVGVKGTIAGLRGRVYRYQGAKLIVTYHPAACLRNPSLKRPVWEDLQLLAREYSMD